MRSCPENKTTAGNVGVGIGIEAHISTIPIPTLNIFMRHWVRHGA